jgi:hypothetical protein
MKGLAEVYKNATGRTPVRSVMAETVKEIGAVGHHQHANRYNEQSPFHAFVSLFISLIPRQLRPLEDEVVRVGFYPTRLDTDFAHLAEHHHRPQAPG